ncbi:hypothetical protein EVAR_20835_1 [Eumeta japonica]|uniref:Uncharacterized protein n=1 Tax=Eumeta variegata TaxID=151549 RepID=A0A4C1UDI3_EUMVA|nr:hypothetical protein EVAR_20835_1 [Eumeta japonica]
MKRLMDVSEAREICKVHYHVEICSLCLPFWAIENQSAREARNREVTARTKPSGRCGCLVPAGRGRAGRAGSGTGRGGASKEPRAVVRVDSPEPVGLSGLSVRTEPMRVRSYANKYTFGP